ncbi:glycosyl transferase family 90 [Pseudorhodoplanes sinuspersici]|uniref:Uncharacterized protein n=1 Tax=Pseudorhodoplanes sinuspersici TaxID=1235591 RepID=A0A1W6ZY38_9HYPH|nr:glycosyl transferase family 90 [Pseudorhodoplanes sinuspersici]ARQ02329.1 hypothetical protein CAK95_26915 [Pseudorhodoplanes sinuspersici]RKE74158.1 glycosyl transferase family 90 [Pseudorhodoplanes sinuspersici]
MEANNEPHRALRYLAKEQLSAWRNKLLSRDDLRQAFVHLNAVPNVSIFEIRKGDVCAWDKAKALEPLDRVRRDLYQSFLKTIVSERRPETSTVLAYALGDRYPNNDSIPTIGYQKRRSHSTILLPDVDFLRYDFYQGEQFQDQIPYLNKRTAAIFVGGTSGGNRISEERVKLVPRIRSALYFKGHKNIDFFVPKIAQIDGEKTKQAIIDLGIAGHPVSWEGHCNYKFRLSMDGNGATCSRVALALKSNSVLIKYSSEWMMHYFPLMRAGEHYIEINGDAEVDPIIEIELNDPGRWEGIASASTSFYETYLTRDRLLDYSAFVLDEYEFCFGHLQD